MSKLLDKVLAVKKKQDMSEFIESIKELEACLDVVKSKFSDFYEGEITFEKLKKEFDVE